MNFSCVTPFFVISSGFTDILLRLPPPDTLDGLSERDCDSEDNDVNEDGDVPADMSVAAEAL